MDQKLTTAEIENAIRRWRLKLPNGEHRCPMCNHNGWTVAPETYCVGRVTPEGDIVLGGDVIPFLVLVCNNCSNMVLLNSIMLGLSQKKKKQSGE